MHRQAPWRLKGDWCQWMLYPQAFAVEFILAKRCLYTHGRILRYAKYKLATQNESDNSKWLAKGKQEEMPHVSDFNCHRSTVQGLSLWVRTCVYAHILYSFFLLITTCFPTFCLCGNSFLQSQRARPLVTDHWSNGQDLVHSPPQPGLALWLGTQASLQAIAGRGHLR